MIMFRDNGCGMTVKQLDEFSTFCESIANRAANGDKQLNQKERANGLSGQTGVHTCM